MLRKTILLISILATSLLSQTPSGTYKIWADSLKVDSAGTFIDVTERSHTTYGKYLHTSAKDTIDARAKSIVSDSLAGVGGADYDSVRAIVSDSLANTTNYDSVRAIVNDSLGVLSVDSTMFSADVKTYIQNHGADTLTINNNPDNKTTADSSSKIIVKDGGVRGVKLAKDVDQTYTILPSGTVTYDGSSFTITGNTIIRNRKGGYLTVAAGTFTCSGAADWYYIYYNGFSTGGTGMATLDFDTDVKHSSTWVGKDSLNWQDVIPLSINDVNGALKWTSLFKSSEPLIFKNFSTTGQLNTAGIATGAITSDKIGTAEVQTADIDTAAVTSAKLAIDVDQTYTILPSGLTYNGSGQFTTTGNTYVLNRNGAYLTVSPGTFTIPQTNAYWSYLYYPGFSTATGSSIATLDFDTDVHLTNGTWVGEDSLHWADVIPLAINNISSKIVWSPLFNALQPVIFQNFTNTGTLNTAGITNGAVTAAKLASDIVRADTTIKVTVKKSGGDYSTIASAIAGVTGTKKEKYLIEIWPGTYEEENLLMKDYVYLKGTSRDSVIIHGEVASDDSAAVCSTNVVDLRTKNTGIENLTVIGHNIRYPVHNDGGSAANTSLVTTYIRNCYIWNQGNDSTQYLGGGIDAVGTGLGSAEELIIEDCILRSNNYRAFASHTSTSACSIASKVVIRRTAMITNSSTKRAMRIGYYQDNNDIYIIENCSLNGSILFDVSGGYDFSNAIMISSCGSVPWEGNAATYMPYELDNVRFCQNTSGGVIEKGMAVKMTAYNEIAKMTNADAIGVFLGFTTEEIADNAWGYVKWRGYIMDDLVSESAAFGDEYGIDATAGTLVEGSGTPTVGRCTFLGNIEILH